MPFLGVGISGVIGVVLSNHGVVLLLESLLLSSGGSGCVSGLLPGGSRLIWGLGLQVHLVIELSVPGGSLDVNSIDVV